MKAAGDVAILQSAPPAGTSGPRLIHGTCGLSKRRLFEPTQRVTTTPRMMWTRGEFPAPVRTGHTSHFKVGDVRAWLASARRAA